MKFNLRNRPKPFTEIGGWRKQAKYGGEDGAQITVENYEEWFERFEAELRQRLTELNPSYACDAPEYYFIKEILGEET